MLHRIQSILAESARVHEALLHDAALQNALLAVAHACMAAFRQEGKVLLCGNGGSAADAQHIAAELSGRFYKDRPPLYAEALHVNTSYLTAVGNDYGYEEVFARMVQAAGRPGDVLLALSTSGRSANVLRAAQAARQAGMTVVALTGAGDSPLAQVAHHVLAAPTHDTPRIQECHILMGHALCALVEEGLFG